MSITETLLSYWSCWQSHINLSWLISDSHRRHSTRVSIRPLRFWHYRQSLVRILLRRCIGAIISTKWLCLHRDCLTLLIKWKNIVGCINLRNLRCYFYFIVSVRHSCRSVLFRWNRCFFASFSMASCSDSFTYLSYISLYNQSCLFTWYVDNSSSFRTLWLSSLNFLLN